MYKKTWLKRVLLSIYVDKLPNDVYVYISFGSCTMNVESKCPCELSAIWQMREVHDDSLVLSSVSALLLAVSGSRKDLLHS